MLSRTYLIAIGMGAQLARASPIDTLNAARAAVWQPTPGTPWQIVLNRELAISSTNVSVTPNVPVYDIDMFDHQGKPTVQNLHQLNTKVICYFSAGSYEPYRPDSSQFPAQSKGNALDGWPDERWLDVRRTDVRQIMSNRIKIASQMGCDAIDPDNMDGYDADNGFGLTDGDLVNYFQFLAAEASRYNLGIGLKNALTIMPRVLSLMKFAVNEQCAQYSECDVYKSVIAAGKPVFHIEYKLRSGATAAAPCTGMKNINSFSTVIKTMDLDGKVTYCDGKTYTTKTK